MKVWIGLPTWKGNVEERKSTFGLVFQLGTEVFSWSSKKQQAIALSSAKAEYMAAGRAATQAVWLRKFLE